MEVERPSCQQSLRQSLSRSRSRTPSFRRFNMQYPEAKRDYTAVDEYHGLTIVDPYRWLENPDSEETKNFIKSQNDLSIPYIDACKHKQNIKSRLSKLWDYEKYSCYYKSGSNYFFLKNTGLQNQSVVYKQDNLCGIPETFFDPNKLSADGTVALSEISFSENGQLFGYTVSASGSDWKTGHFIKVDTGERYPEVLRKIKFSSLEWTHDNLGVFYACYPAAGKADGCETETTQHQKLYYHKVGNLQKNDVLIAEFGDPLIRINAQVSDCGNYLICLPRKDCRDNMVYFYDLTDYGISKNMELTPIVDNLEYDYTYVSTYETGNYFRTNWKAPNYQLISIDFENYNEECWQIVIPEKKHDVLSWVAPACGHLLLVCYIRDVSNILQLCDWKGRLVTEFELELGTIVDYFAEKKHSEIFFKFQSFLSPGKIYRYDLLKSPLESEVIRQTTIPEFNPCHFIVKQVFYKSQDDVDIPMFIMHKRKALLDGMQPCLLYGYGGFNISVQPSFSVTRIVFMQNLNGIVAIPNIRGGGEYGATWHNAGRRHLKQNCFNDFQAAAEYLINENYTSARLLTIQGGSNGGLLIAACINQRPNLFGAAICQVGVLDMLKFHKFTIGHAWTSDYGCSDNEEDFKTMLLYSPLHNTHVPIVYQYPPTLLLTADHDDRVVPLHSLKFIAQLQYIVQKSELQENPLLIRVETKAGHGRGKPTTKQIDEATDILCFILQTLGVIYHPH